MEGRRIRYDQKQGRCKKTVNRKEYVDRESRSSHKEEKRKEDEQRRQWKRKKKDTKRKSGKNHRKKEDLRD